MRNRACFVGGSMCGNGAVCEMCAGKKKPALKNHPQGHNGWSKEKVLETK